MFDGFCRRCEVEKVNMMGRSPAREYGIPALSALWCSIEAIAMATHFSSLRAPANAVPHFLGQVGDHDHRLTAAGSIPDQCVLGRKFKRQKAAAVAERAVYSR